MDRLSRRQFLALGAGLAFAGVSCTPGSSTGPAKAPPRPARTGVTETEPVTLTVLDQESGKVGQVWDQLNAGFHKRYPNVRINRVQRGLGELKAVLKLAISGPRPPDVVEANQGWPDMGEMVKAGLLLPLDNYAKAYGWFDRVSENVNAVNSWSPDGKQFGTGSLFGFTNEGELVGVFYNKSILSSLGLTLPSTFAEFENALAVAKQAGEIPIQFGDLDQFPGIHTWTAIQERFAPKSYMTDLVFGLQYNNLSFDTSQNREAATTLQGWARNAYFASDFLATGYGSSVSSFSKGQGLFMITGNWIVANLGADNPDFGFMAMPPREPGAPPVATGGPGYPLSIPAQSKHPDVAAAYIDWMTNEHATQMFVPTGELALNLGFTPSGVVPGTLLSDLVDVVAKVTAANGIVPYEDWATPSFYNTLTAAVQELMASKITPQQFLTKVQADYSEFQRSRPSLSTSTATPSPTG